LINYVSSDSQFGAPRLFGAQGQVDGQRSDAEACAEDA